MLTRLWFTFVLMMIFPTCVLGAEGYFIKEKNRVPTSEMVAHPVCVVSRTENDEITYYLDSDAVTPAVTPCRFGGSRGLAYLRFYVDPVRSMMVLDLLVWQEMVFSPYEVPFPMYPGMYALKSHPPTRPVPTKKWYWVYKDTLGVWCRLQKDLGRSTDCVPEKQRTK